MDFEGETAPQIQMEWHGSEAPLVMSDDLRSLLIQLGQFAAVKP